MPLPALVLYPVISAVASVGLSLTLTVSAKKSRKVAKAAVTKARTDKRITSTASDASTNTGQAHQVVSQDVLTSPVPAKSSVGSSVMKTESGVMRTKSDTRRTVRRHRSRAAESGQPALAPAASWRTEVAEIVDSPLGMPMLLASGGLALSSAALLFPALRLPALALSLVAAGPLLSDGVARLKKRKVDVNVMNLTFVTAATAVGQPFLISFLCGIKYSGDMLTAEAEDRTRHDLTSIFGGDLRTAWVRAGDTEVEMPLEKLSAGDVVICRAGETIPVDGEIQSGTAMVDQHTLFGEQYPVAKALGDPVYAGTTLVSGDIAVTLHQAGSETVAGKVTTLLAHTADYRTRVERNADRELRYSIPAILGASAVAVPVLGVPAALGLMMSCPGLNFVFTAPFTTISALQAAGREGILIKDGRALEILPEIDLVLFDKTGTLTMDTPEVGEVTTLGEVDAEEMVRLAALAEARHSHPIAKALREHAGDLETIPPVSESELHLGRGIAALVGNRRIAVGSAKLLEQLDLTIPPRLFEIGAVWSERGSTTVFVAIDDDIAGAIELRHRLRPGAADCVSALQARGIACEIVSGDSEATTRNIAGRLGIEGFHANCLPDRKRAIVQERQQDGRRVCFVGDGINDAVALKAADISVSMSGASHAATDTAAIILLSPELDNVTKAFELSGHFTHANQIGRGLSYALPAGTLISTIALGTSPWIAVLGQELSYWCAMGAAVFIPRTIEHKPIKKKQPRRITGRKRITARQTSPIEALPRQRFEGEPL